MSYTGLYVFIGAKCVSLFVPNNDHFRCFLDRHRSRGAPSIATLRAPLVNLTLDDLDAVRSFMAHSLTGAALDGGAGRRQYASHLHGLSEK